MNTEKFALLQVNEESLKKFDLQVKDKRELHALINDSIYRVCARTSKEKFEVLDLRDKVLKLIRYEVSNQTASGGLEQTILIGSCMDMCPEKERYSREYLSFSSRYEMSNDVIDYRLMVKEYSRSSADQDLPLPNELRPIDVLYETMLYLIDEVISKIVLESSQSGGEEMFSIGDWYDFAWNRTRAIRKEIIQQRLLLNDHNLNELSHGNDLIRNGLGGVLIIEQCARFHIMCAYRLSDQSPKVFSFKINEDNLKNCFQSLRQYYESGTMGGLQPSPNEAEFRSYIILLNLNESDILCEIQHWPAGIRDSSHVRFALAIYYAYNSRNYVRFFRLFKSQDCEYLHACILHRYVCRMRCEAFKIIFTAYKDQKERVFPLSKLADLLAFDSNEDVYDYCDVFEMETDEVNIIMRTNMSYSCFKLSKPNEERLQVRRSRLLVEGKFENGLVSNDRQMSKIIRGAAVPLTSSCFGLKHTLNTSFNSDDYFSSEEINALLDLLRPVGSDLSRLKREETRGAKSLITPSKLNTICAHNIIKKAHMVASAKKNASSNEEGHSAALISKRKSSTSSASSVTSVSSTASNKTTKSKTSKPKADANSASLFKPQKTINKSSRLVQNVFGTHLPAATAAPTPLFGKLEPTVKLNPFSMLASNKSDVQLKKEEPSLFWKPKPSEVDVVKTNENLFENLLKKSEQDDIRERSDKLLNQKCETFFQSLHLELINDISREYLQINRYYPVELTDSLINTVVKQQIIQIYDELMPVFRNSEQIELRRRQIELDKRKHEELTEIILEEVFNGLIASVVRENCMDFMASQIRGVLNVYDDLLCGVFQKEFEIILKQIANELNNELLMDRLVESVYFNSASGDEDMDSIYMQDMHSYLHQCLHEFTRLNLNVNRELYFELKQALILNEKKHLFRKWRLKLSLKLLSSAQKRTSHDLKRVAAPQLGLISFIKSYGVYLFKHLNRFQQMSMFMIDTEDNANYSLIHSEEFQMHLTWNMSLNHKHCLYELLLANYFDIIHNRDEQVLLPATASHELLAKIVVAMPRLNARNQDMEAIKRWLMTKLFRFSTNDKVYSYETQHSEQLAVNMLHTNPYGLRFSIRVCPTDMSASELATKLNKRQLYGANALMFILMPLECADSAIEFTNYLHKMRHDFYQILRLFNENLNTGHLDLYQFMFVSYLNDHEETKKAIQFILDDKASQNYCYCLLEGDVVKDNGLFQHTYKNFLKQIYTQNARSHLVSEAASDLLQLNTVPKTVSSNYEAINNAFSLAAIYEMSILKLLEFLSHSQASIYVPFEALVDEYNARLDMLVKMLTRDEYRQVAWPVQELCDIDFASRDNSIYWMLKYWNSNECFDGVIKKGFFNLMYLNDLAESPSDDQTTELLCGEQDEWVEFDLIERKFFSYLEKLLKTKQEGGSLPPHAQCVKSTYQLESSIKSTVKNMRKLAVPNAKTNMLFISKSSIQWPQLVLAIVEYLLANGFLMFKSVAPIRLQEFYFYCNLNEIKNYDWINNASNNAGMSLISSPTSSVFSNYSDMKVKSNYLMNKYAKKPKQTNLKRRISDQSIGNSSNDTIENTSRQLNLNASEEASVLNESQLFTNLNNLDTSCNLKQLKYQRLMTPPSHKKEPAASTQFDLKFEEFLKLLDKEKENNRQFETKLSNFSESNFEKDDQVLSISFNFLEHDSAKGFNKSVPNNDSNKSEQTLENLLERLNDEKLKNEKFNSKLNQMLNIFK